MFSKGSKLYSVIHQKCPRCQEGKMFKYGPYSKHFIQMHDNCPVCGFDLRQEPSFYFGAMYFSYGIQVIVFVMVYFALRFTINPDTWTYVIYMIIGSIVILPLNFRWSRAAWINLFVAYDKSLEKLTAFRNSSR
jgi:uncharacterized protein (DUF983 family)